MILVLRQERFEEPIKDVAAATAAAWEEQAALSLREADQHTEIAARHISEANRLRSQATSYAAQAQTIRLKAAAERIG
jgi:hypothetical protein